MVSYAVSGALRMTTSIDLRLHLVMVSSHGGVSSGLQSVIDGKRIFSDEMGIHIFISYDMLHRLMYLLETFFRITTCNDYTLELNNAISRLVFLGQL